MNDPMMHMTVMPGWLRTVFAVAMCGVLAVHLWHARTMAGQRRWWHVGHCFMAAGMVVMYAVPLMTMPALQGAGAALFAALTASSAVATSALRRSEGVLNPLWVASGLDMLAMTYMLLPHGARVGAITGVFVVYLLVQTVAWAFGLWDRAPAFRSPAPTVLDVPPEGRLAGTGTNGALRTGTTVAVGLTAHSTPAVRTSLALMTAAMATMLAAM